MTFFQPSSTQHPPDQWLNDI